MPISNEERNKLRTRKLFVWMILFVLALAARPALCLISEKTYSLQFLEDRPFGNVKADKNHYSGVRATFPGVPFDDAWRATILMATHTGWEVSSTDKAGGIIIIAETHEAMFSDSTRSSAHCIFIDNNPAGTTIYIDLYNKNDDSGKANSYKWFDLIAEYLTEIK